MKVQLRPEHSGRPVMHAWQALLKKYRLATPQYFSTRHLAHMPADSGVQHLIKPFAKGTEIRQVWQFYYAPCSKHIE